MYVIYADMLKSSGASSSLSTVIAGTVLYCNLPLHRFVVNRACSERQQRLFDIMYSSYQRFYSPFVIETITVVTIFIIMISIIIAFNAIVIITFIAIIIIIIIITTTIIIIIIMIIIIIIIIIME